MADLMAFKIRASESVDYCLGSIVEHPADVLVNTVNCQLSPSGNGVMDAGAAKAFKERFPSIMKDYEAAIRSGELRPGKALLFDLPDGRKWAALATKDAWKDSSRMEWVEAGLVDLGEKVRAAGLKSIAMPPPGCGNGGLDWRQVEPLVHKHLRGINVSLFAKPSGALVPVERDAPTPEQEAAKLAAERDDRIRKPLYGKLDSEPDVTFGQPLSPSLVSVKAALMVKEDGGRKPIPVIFKSDEMSVEDAHQAAADIAALKQGSQISAAGSWKKAGEGWSFRAERIARGNVPLSDMKFSSPSPAVIADPAIRGRLISAAEAARTGPGGGIPLEESNGKAVHAEARAMRSGKVNETTSVAIEASMYFNYGRDSRPEIGSKSTFDAILDGERTSTTRYFEWRGSEKWEKLKQGDLVRFYDDKEMKGRSVVVAVDDVKRIDMSKMSSEQLEDWSKSEGWSVDYAKKSAGRYGPGVQIRYRPIPDQAILEGRAAGRAATEINAADVAVRPAAQQEEAARPSQAARMGMMAALSSGMGR